MSFSPQNTRAFDLPHVSPEPHPDDAPYEVAETALRHLLRVHKDGRLPDGVRTGAYTAAQALQAAITTAKNSVR